MIVRVKSDEHVGTTFLNRRDLGKGGAAISSTLSSDANFRVERERLLSLAQIACTLFLSLSLALSVS